MKHNHLKRLLILVFILAQSFTGFSAWINFSPQTIVQPDGSIIECFGTGDEFYNWLHDENGYTIIQLPVCMTNTAQRLRICSYVVPKLMR